MSTTALQTTKLKPNSVPCNAPAAARNDVLEPIPLATRDGPSVDEFLDTTKRVLGYAITTKGISIARDSDIDIASGKGEITVRSVLADGTQLEARRVIQRHTIRWRRLWPYLAIILVLTTALILAWHGDAVLKLFQELALNVAG